MPAGYGRYTIRMNLVMDASRSRTIHDPELVRFLAPALHRTSANTRRNELGIVQRTADGREKGTVVVSHVASQALPILGPDIGDRAHIDAAHRIDDETDAQEA